ncbi:MAG: phospholipase D family protein [Chitinophagaceae bacterium]|nr:phospholipase D family protein [Chitinophagaceae bacterium]
MAKFLNTTGVSYHLEELIKGTKDRLILVSPYLQFTDRIKEHLSNLNVQKRDIRIIYRENKLQLDENNWLESQIGIRTSICKNLHAKCYLNENEAIITSMNLYEFSQQNNNEMGIYISKNQDVDLYNATLEEVQRLLTISEEIRVTVKKVNAESSVKTAKQVIEDKAFNASGKNLSTTALSKEIGISAKDLFIKFEKIGYIEKNQFDEWELTKLGKKMGGQIKSGQYGDYIAWPENIKNLIK